MAVIIQAVMVIPQPSPGEEQSEETEIRSVGKQVCAHKETRNRDIYRGENVGSKEDRGDQAQQEQADVDQLAPRGVEITEGEKEGEVKHGRHRIIRENITADCEKHY